MNQNLNNQQLKAIDHNRNIVLNAGAGTGKTKVLVDRIVCLLEFIETLELKHIVAITFTVKAASELQDRLKDAFIEKIDVLRNEKTIAKFKRGLEQLTQANITTIHGFLNRCLRTYSVEADIDSLFRIINDFERIELKESAIIASLKNELMTNDAITSLYKIYGRFDFFRHMSEILEHPQLLENISSNSADELRGYWQTLRQSYIRDLLAKIRVDKQFAFILESVSKMRIGGNLSKDSFEFKQALQQVHLDLTDLGALLNLRESFMNKDASVSKNFLKKFDSNNHHMIGQLAQKVDFYCQQILPDFNQRDEDYFTIYPDLIAFAKTVAATQYDHKKEANVLDFNDLEIQTKRLLENSHHARSELRQNYRFFLIDEFQDTNQFQWQIINQLVSNDRQQLRPQKTFIVGDPKQSIYGFRNADVRVFKQVSERLTECNRKNNSLTKSFSFANDINSTMAEKEGLIVLNENYRSGKKVVQLVNNLFERIFDHKSEYDVKPQSLIKANPKNTSEQDNELILAVASESKLEYKLVCKRIIELIADGFHFKDICILVRNRMQSDALESALLDSRIPYQSFLNQNFFNRQEIYDAYSLIRFVNYPEDDIALSSVLKSPFFSMTDTEIFELKIDQRKTSLLALLQKTKHPHMDRLNKIRTLASRMPVYDWLNYCFFQLGYFIKESPGRNQQESNIIKLIEIVQRRAMNSANDVFDIESFIKKQIDMSFEEAEAEIIINENDDKVQLMTIHNSKGLEFPVVIICDMNKNNTRSSDSLYVNFDHGFYLNCSQNDDEKTEKGFCESFFKVKKMQRELAEEKRILYVAMTRAMDKIIMTGSLKERSLDKVSSNSFLDLIKQHTKQNFIAGTELKLPDTSLKISVVSEDDFDVTSIGTIPLLIDPIKKKFDPATMPVSKGNYYSVTKLQRFKSVQQYKQNYLLGWFDEDPLFQTTKERQDETEQEKEIGGSVYGSILHEVMEKSEFMEITTETCQLILRNYVLSGEETDAITEQLLADYKNYKQSDKLQFIRQAEKQLQEQRISIKIADDYFEGILDLLVFKNKQWLILDYKSNRLSSDEIEAKSEAYHFQMKAYAFLLSRRYPEQQYYAVHLYYPRIDGLFTMEFSHQDLDGFEQELAKRIAEIKEFEREQLVLF